MKSFAKVFKKIDFERDVHWMKDCGHWIHAERLTEFISVVSSFLEECNSNYEN